VRSDSRKNQAVLLRSLVLSSALLL